MLEYKQIEIAEIDIDAAYKKFNDKTGLGSSLDPSYHGFEGYGHHFCRVAAPGSMAGNKKYYVDRVVAEQERKKNPNKSLDSSRFFYVHKFGPNEIIRYLQAQNELPDCTIVYYINAEDYAEPDIERDDEDDNF